jgi:hypothetical protein
MTTCKDAIKIFEESEVRNKEKLTAEEARNVSTRAALIHNNLSIG